MYFFKGISSLAVLVFPNEFFFFATLNHFRIYFKFIDKPDALILKKLVTANKVPKS